MHCIFSYSYTWLFTCCCMYSCCCIYICSCKSSCRHYNSHCTSTYYYMYYYTCYCTSRWSWSCRYHYIIPIHINHTKLYNIKSKIQIFHVPIGSYSHKIQLSTEDIMDKLVEYMKPGRNECYKCSCNALRVFQHARRYHWVASSVVDVNIQNTSGQLLKVITAAIAVLFRLSTCHWLMDYICTRLMYIHHCISLWHRFDIHVTASHFLPANLKCCNYILLRLRTLLETETVLTTSRAKSNKLQLALRQSDFLLGNTMIMLSYVSRKRNLSSGVLENSTIKLKQTTIMLREVSWFRIRHFVLKFLLNLSKPIQLTIMYTQSIIH